MLSGFVFFYLHLFLRDDFILHVLLAVFIFSSSLSAVSLFFSSHAFVSSLLIRLSPFNSGWSSSSFSWSFWFCISVFSASFRFFQSSISQSHFGLFYSSLLFSSCGDFHHHSVGRFGLCVAKQGNSSLAVAKLGLARNVSQSFDDVETCGSEISDNIWNKSVYLFSLKQTCGNAMKWHAILFPFILDWRQLEIEPTNQQIPFLPPRPRIFKKKTTFFSSYWLWASSFWHNQLFHFFFDCQLFSLRISPAAVRNEMECFRDVSRRSRLLHSHWQPPLRRQYRPRNSNSNANTRTAHTTGKERARERVGEKQRIC